MCCFNALPTHLLEVILCASGSGGPAAAITCKAFSISWRSAMSVATLAVQYLLARYGRLTAARHMYTMTHHTQLLHNENSIDQDETMLNLLRQLYQAGAELVLHDALLLMQAAHAGHKCVVLELLHVANPTSFALSRALTAAAETDQRSIVRILLKAGAPPSAYHSAALVAAAAGGDSEIVYVLCAAGADPTADASHALRRAVQLGHVKAAEVLLMYGADARALCSAALVHACEFPTAISIVRSSGGENRYSGSQKPRDTSAKKYVDGNLASTGTTNRIASSDGNRQMCNDDEARVLALVELLLRAGADVQAHGRPALEAAAARGYAAVVGALLAAGADPGACNSSALVAASIQGHAGVVSMLLESGADPWDVTDLALFTASERGHKPVLRAIRAAQIAAGTGEELLFGSSGGTVGSTTTCSDGCTVSNRHGCGLNTPRVPATPTARWSVSPRPVASASRWSFNVTIQPVCAATAMMQASQVQIPMEGASLEAFLSNM